MAPSEELLALVKSHGPVVPSDVAKKIKQNLLFTSAMLSELASRKLVKISHLKIGGGSPLYYCPEHHDQLVRFISHLDPKDQHAANALKEHRILRDNELTPLLRVSLRGIKDFAVALEVTIDGNTEIFWKWYLTDDQTASDLIHQKIDPKVQPAKEEIKKVEKEPEKKEPEQQTILKEENTIKKAEAKVEPKIGSVKEEPKAEIVKEETKKESKKRSIKKGSTASDSEFFERVSKFFEEKDITVFESKVVRKGREYEFVLSVPSAVGAVSFLCIAKNKKSVSDGDLATLHLAAQAKRLPLIVLTDGKLTKKAQDLIKAELKGMTISRIDGS